MSPKFSEAFEGDVDEGRRGVHRRPGENFTLHGVHFIRVDSKCHGIFGGFLVAPGEHSESFIWGYSGKKQKAGIDISRTDPMDI